MKLLSEPAGGSCKPLYETPLLEVFTVLSADVLTSSGGNDENQGEWDPLDL